MNRIAIGFAGLLALIVVGPVRSADAPAGKDAHKPVKVNAHLHGEGGKHEEKVFDLSNKAHRDEFVHALEHGHVEDMHLEKSPDIFGLKRWDLGIWSIVIFLVLFFVLKKFAWGPMLEGLTKREESIRSALELAEKTRLEAESMHARHQAELTATGAKVATMMDEGRRDAVALKEQLAAEGKAEIQKDRDRLLREVEMAKDQALNEIWQKAVDLASLMSTKAIRRELSTEDHRRLLDESLGELKTAGTEFGKRGVTGTGL